MNELLEIGKIVKSNGLKGRLKVLSYSESAQKLETLTRVFVGGDRDHVSPFSVSYLRVKGGTFFLGLEGVEAVDATSELVGQSVYIPAEPLPEGEYYWKDIVGLDIVTEDGRRLGQVVTILSTGSNDVYVCGGKREILIPAFDDVVQKIDLGKGVMVVRLPEGL